MNRVIYNALILLLFVGNILMGVTISTENSENQSDLALKTNTNDTIIYTANQEWLSRIYLLEADGTVITYYEYEFYRFTDLEIINGEIYVAEAFAPRVYKINLSNGNLDVVVDDWSLYYFYNVVFDGNYFYIDEWDLNKYDIEGNKIGTAAFDEFVAGSAWDGKYLWTMDDENHVKCWDVSDWPIITEMTEHNFTPPSANCRGLWFDGQHFWSAESLDGALGFIYQFDYEGNIIQQIIEPAFSGWGVCAIHVNSYICGDTNSDNEINILDITYLISFLYMDGPPPADMNIGDVNADGNINVLDVTYLIAYLYKGGPEPNCP